MTEPTPAATTAPLVDRLAALAELSDVPREQLEWLVDHGELHAMPDGAEVRGVDDLTGLMVLVSGRFSVRLDRLGADREVREITPGRVTGFLPYSRMTNPRGYLVADGPVEFIQIHRQDLRAMTSACYEFTGLCVQEMLARVRVFKAEDKHQEKLAALGRLSAGLAHELNNPASAVVRSAGDLEASRVELAAASRALGALGLGDDAMAALASLEDADRRAAGAALTPLGRATLEEDLVDWLELRGVDSELAFPLVDNGITVEDLERVAAALDPAQVAGALRYAAASAAARSLATDVLSAATRIHTLVAAVKRHTHMDQAPTAEPMRLEEHVADALTLLGSKAALKAVEMDLSVEEGLPAVMGSVADLNQVWIHLIDNAIDAVAEEGRIAVEVGRCRDGVAVAVIDDGPGIPEADRERVFEPFFTTKDVSQGRGLGLDIVRTVVRTHRGTVELRCEPGRTEFRVTLPEGAPAA